MGRGEGGIYLLEYEWSDMTPAVLEIYPSNPSSTARLPLS